MVSVGDPIYAGDLPQLAISGSVNLDASSTTLQNVTGLSRPVTGGRTYQMRTVIYASNASGTTEDIKIGFSFPTGTLRAGAQGGTSTGVSGTTASDMQLIFQSFTSGSTAISFGLSTNITTLEIVGIYACTTSGTFQVMAAQNTSGSNISSIAASSHLTLLPQ